MWVFLLWWSRCSVGVSNYLSVQVDGICAKGKVFMFIMFSDHALGSHTSLSVVQSRHLNVDWIYATNIQIQIQFRNQIRPKYNISIYSNSYLHVQKHKDFNKRTITFIYFFNFVRWKILGTCLYFFQIIVFCQTSSKPGILDRLKNLVWLHIDLHQVTF